MKNQRNNSDFKKRLTIGLILIAAAAALGFALSGMLGDDSTVYQRMAYVSAVGGLGMGGLMFIIQGWLGFAQGVGFVLFIALTNGLPHPWNAYVFIASLALIFGIPRIAKLRKKEKADVPDELPEFVLDDPELASNVFVIRPMNDRVYQLFHTDGELRAYWVGDNTRGLREKKFILSGEALRSQEKRDLFISEAKVEKLRIETPENLQCSLRVKLRADGKNYTFQPFATTDKMLLGFLRDFAVDAQIDPDNRLSPLPQERGEGTAQNQKRVAVLRKVLTVLMCLAIAAQVPWLFLDVPYRPFAVLSLLPLPAVLLLYLLFPNDLSMSENRVRIAGRISIPGMLMGPAFVPFLRTALDFNFLDWPRLGMISGILFLVLMVAVLILTREWLRKPSLLIGIAFALAFYLPGLTGQANVLLDDADPEVALATVADMRIRDGSRTPDRYELILDDGSGETFGLDVAQADYEATSVGDTVYVLTYPGSLGIPYAEAYSEGWES